MYKFKHYGELKQVYSVKSCVLLNSKTKTQFSTIEIRSLRTLIWSTAITLSRHVFIHHCGQRVIGRLVAMMVVRVIWVQVDCTDRRGTADTAVLPPLPLPLPLPSPLSPRMSFVVPLGRHDPLCPSSVHIAPVVVVVRSSGGGIVLDVHGGKASLSMTRWSVRWRRLHALMVTTWSVSWRRLHALMVTMSWSVSWRRLHALHDGDQMESKLEEARVERPQAPAVGPWDAAYEEAFQLQFQNALAVAVHASLPLGLAALLVVVVAAVRSM